MRKYLLFISLIIAASFEVNAQYHTLLKSTNVWSYASNYYPVRRPSPNQLCFYPNDNFSFLSGKEYTYGDTVFNSVTYKKLYIDDIPCLYGFIREDSIAQKVYFRDVIDNPEILLYDFSMQVNDSILINFYDEPGYYFSGYYRLDSIKTINIQAGPRKKFYLNMRGETGKPIIWIEGVGSYSDLVYPYMINEQGMGLLSTCNYNEYAFPQILICFEHDKKVFFDSCMVDIAFNWGCYNPIDSCNYGSMCSSVNENASGFQITISPNPSNGIVTLINETEYPVTGITIYDLTGRVILQNKFEEAIANEKKELNLSLPSGTYLVAANSKNGLSVQKIHVLRE